MLRVLEAKSWDKIMEGSTAKERLSLLDTQQRQYQAFPQLENRSCGLLPQVELKEAFYVAHCPFLVSRLSLSCNLL
jgi:hypothetical protein